MASGQITLRKVDGWKTLHLAPAEQTAISYVMAHYIESFSQP
jgi:hypothetical protein